MRVFRIFWRTRAMLRRKAHTREQLRRDVENGGNTVFYESSAKTLRPAALVYSCTSPRFYLLKGPDCREHLLFCQFFLLTWYYKVAITPHRMNTAVHWLIRYG